MPSIDEQVIDFYYELFGRIFTQPFRPKIKERLRQDAVARQVEEAAGAASQALTRFFLSEQLTDEQAAVMLRGFAPLYDLIKLEDIANPNRTPEALVEELLVKLPCPMTISREGCDAVYRVALHLTVQVLMLVGPVMTEWQRLSFASTYEMPRRIVSQLNQITEGLKAFAGAGQAAADERYELAYRDHLLQRFYRVEAGTVRMTTNLYVDLRELFVMPRLAVRPTPGAGADGAGLDAEALMKLADARAVFGRGVEREAAPEAEKNDEGVAAVEQVRRAPRNVVVGLPGSGKSTFFEWLQLSVANVDEELVAGGAQAIPLLLRVRQLDPHNLPHGAGLIEKATASRDRATLMPDGWLDRQMKAGRVLFMLDGLDETDPTVRDERLLPWLAALCEKYPDCLYLVSSRPVGYPPGALRELEFAECDLLDFAEPQIAEYTRHWCTAIRLAQNEPDEEARREGEREGEHIVAGFKDHPYIRNLARNPLMLSAVCLVNYFEGGQLPKDRAVLYRLCVEGLLHHWDQRRGIHSAYSLDEKLRVSREVAVAMQADDHAEYEASKVLKIFAHVLRDEDRAEKLLEHIRYRTGLLVERRAGIFAFAHLTFQEYLAALAVHEGNHLNIDAAQLAREHADGRWNEVIALYCGLAPARAARRMIEGLIAQPDTPDLSNVLTDSFMSAVSDVAGDTKLRKRVLERIAVSPVGLEAGTYKGHLERFPDEEVIAIANACIGKISSNNIAVSEAYEWLVMHSDKMIQSRLLKRLKGWRKLNQMQVTELNHLAHSIGEEKILLSIADDSELYTVEGAEFQTGVKYETQAEIALLGLFFRIETVGRITHVNLGMERALLQVLRAMTQQEKFGSTSLFPFRDVFDLQRGFQNPKEVSSWAEFISLTRRLADLIEKHESERSQRKHPKKENKPAVKENSVVDVMRAWASRLEEAMTSDLGQKPETKSTKVLESHVKRAAKNSNKRRSK